MVRPEFALEAVHDMLRHLCVAYAEDERAAWALELGRELARRARARLTIVHVAPFVDESIDPREELEVELLGMREDVYWRQRLTGLAMSADRAIDVDVRVPLGSVGDQLLALLRAETPDLLLIGARGTSGIGARLAPRLQHRLLAGAPCPVLLVTAPVATRRDLILASPRPMREDNRSLAVARMLASALRWTLIRWPAPEGGEPADLTHALAACREWRPAFVVTDGERFHGIRDRLGLSRLATLIEYARCPVLVVGRGVHRGSIVGDAASRPGTAMSTPQMLERPPGVADQRTSARPRAERRPSLLRQLFAANALVLAAALLVLLVAPVSVSREVVLTEALALSLGLAAMLVVNLLLFRRTLEPLRQLSAMMASIDPRQPGWRLTLGEARVAEVRALADSFNGMLDRLEGERRNSARVALAAQEDERRRIAHEIHDQVGQMLTALMLQAQRASQPGNDGNAEPLEQLSRTALEALDEVRRIGRELRPEALDDLGLGNALIALCRRLSAQSGIRIVSKIEPGVPALRSEVDLVVYRVGQEAITNALRHASASQVEVGLRVVEGMVELSVSDDGCGLPATLPDKTAGISGMRERASLVGGSLSIRSRREMGSEVVLGVPVPEAVA